MFLDGRIIQQQKYGIVLQINKTEFPNTPANYEPITLLNTDYKF